MSSKNIYRPVSCSCIICRKELTTANLDKHYKSKRCTTGTPQRQKLTNCKYCHFEFGNLSVSEIANHSRWCKENPKNKKEVAITCKCGILFCGLTPNSRIKTCSVECQNSMSELTKAKISEKRKLFLKENPELHPWKNSNKLKSKPCENVKQFLISNNINFIEEFSPSKERHYSIDIAFPNLKIGIEINGNQHYNNDGTLTQYYQERHDFIENLGWKLIEVHYSRCFSEENIKSILNFNIPHDSNLQIDIIKSFINKKKPKSRNRKQYSEDVKSKTDSKWEEIKDSIFDIDIEFDKFGWVKKLATYLGISSQKVNSWMKRYHFDFYQAQCFKRKSH